MAYRYTRHDPWRELADEQWLARALYQCSVHEAAGHALLTIATGSEQISKVYVVVDPKVGVRGECRYVDKLRSLSLWQRLVVTVAGEMAEKIICGMHDPHRNWSDHARAEKLAPKIGPNKGVIRVAEAAARGVITENLPAAKALALKLNEVGTMNHADVMKVLSKFPPIKPPFTYKDATYHPKRVKDAPRFAPDGGERLYTRPGGNITLAMVDRSDMQKYLEAADNHIDGIVAQQREEYTHTRALHSGAGDDDEPNWDALAFAMKCRLRADGRVD